MVGVCSGIWLEYGRKKEEKMVRKWLEILVGILAGNGRNIG